MSCPSGSICQVVREEMAATCLKYQCSPGDFPCYLDRCTTDVEADVDCLEVTCWDEATGQPGWLVATFITFGVMLAMLISSLLTWLVMRQRRQQHEAGLLDNRVDIANEEAEFARNNLLWNPSFNPLPEVNLGLRGGYRNEPMNPSQGTSSNTSPTSGSTRSIPEEPEAPREEWQFQYLALSRRCGIRQLPSWVRFSAWANRQPDAVFHQGWENRQQN